MTNLQALLISRLPGEVRILKEPSPFECGPSRRVAAYGKLPAVPEHASLLLHPIEFKMNKWLPGMVKDDEPIVLKLGKLAEKAFLFIKAPGSLIDGERIHRPNPVLHFRLCQNIKVLQKI